MITIDDFKEIKNKFEINQLVYNRIEVNFENYCGLNDDYTMFKISEYVSNENSETISNLFKILELNSDFWLNDGYIPNFEDEGNKKCTEIYFNNLLIGGYNKNVGKDGETVKVFKIFKGKNLIYDGPSAIFDFLTSVNYSAYLTQID
ncbi:hypothetical protein DDB_G0268780 [Dictyostelium discoideum AX4]|uniref:Uncharacterized protein n=1 Tax=Dictyostelium discoideum TaxID=44689 RepID=Q55ER2_DICDI|nr:hypothetical protein DDB_G0268780 [Dictyostelium discoideum AX4]EAL72979.1 hypothetical protein DDB_G0268780 [Dictyostelium discoideum AX4]|eukprot:XP_646958.1 hypothetical protein DDB_G0268780 [Dictyostelium discoideum AX4]